jgi:hypothetical protein
LLDSRFAELVDRYLASNVMLPGSRLTPAAVPATSSRIPLARERQQAAPELAITP